MVSYNQIPVNDWDSLEHFIQLDENSDLRRIYYQVKFTINYFKGDSCLGMGTVLQFATDHFLEQRTYEFLSNSDDFFHCMMGNECLYSSNELSYSCSLCLTKYKDTPNFKNLIGVTKISPALTVSAPIYKAQEEIKKIIVLLLWRYYIMG